MRDHIIWNVIDEVAALCRTTAKNRPLLAAASGSIAVLLMLHILFRLLSLLSTSVPSNVGLVRGIVAIDGTPAAGVFVRFEPVSGDRASHGVTDSKGRYALRIADNIRGAIVGEHVVRLTTGVVTQESLASEKLSVANERLPERYNLASALRAEVVKGTNEFNWSCDTRK